ncbi:unnamed protein product [Brassicogethes aeneus]|uniref:Cytohesin Ubiquitin Protein Inducing domain-containing protein n=1 Tax=Brassicogethes aeneus TaxID=1431903 RepID=A0A9P0BIC1_BRAAE|nr:unnamed protein product [Brassicogethes aeneus]
MDDGASVGDNKTAKMGASNNPNADRFAALQEKKKQLEETLEKRIKELQQLCKQETELTGSIPPETPIDAGENLPFRRRVGTAYQLSESLVKNPDHNELELQIQIHMQLAEAAADLANENKSKTLRRHHLAEYQKHKQTCMILREKLTNLKDKAADQVKQKKKHRSSESDDNVSVNTMATSEPFVKSNMRQSLRSLKQPMQQNENNVELRYSMPGSYHFYRGSEIPYLQRHDDGLTSGFYALSLNGYKSYMERRENINYNTQSAVHLPQYATYQQHGSQMQNNYTFHQRSPPQNYHHPNVHYPEHRYSNISNPPHQYRQSSSNVSNFLSYKPNQQYYPSQSFSHSNIRQYQTLPDPNTYRNPHQIQPHQQYEHNVVGAGLGGCWRSMENGEMVWCNSSAAESNWERDKGFGSLDRRKNKRVSKRISPTVDNKSATIASPSYTDHVRTASVKSHIITRRQENRQLIRTQSLGSVGAQTVVDSVCPSDDNSSINSDTHSINEINLNSRKPKEKEWLETSLDGPVSPTHSIVSHTQSTTSTISNSGMRMSSHSPHSMHLPPPPHYNVPPPPPPPHYNMPPPAPSPSMPPPLILSPDEKYMQPPPLTPKPSLEIPAESNRSPRVPDGNIEMFNNNIPENCTVVQAGYEETKPFEMSDFYKYSTKYKKSPAKEPEVRQREGEGNAQKCLNQQFDEHNNYQPELPAKPLHYRNSNISMDSPDTSNSNINNSLNLSQISAVADNFSAEMNAWYKEHQIDNNNTNGSNSKSRSTATLV